MCVSALVENELERVAAKFSMSNLPVVQKDGDLHLPRRIEAHDPALVVRLGTGGRLVAEPMTFNPYVLKRASLGGDMWAETMLSRRHGIIVLKGFSEWVSLGLLLSQRIIPLHEAHCAFNRFAMPTQRYGMGQGDRLVLANFNPANGGSLLVPVLFDARRDGEGKSSVPQEFAVVSDGAGAAMAFGSEHSPVSLSLESALEWLCTDPESLEEVDDRDFTSVLDENTIGPLQFALFKSA